MPEHTRRSTLKLAGASVAAAVVPVGAAVATEHWTVAETPVDATLHDVAYASDGAYAVGEGGVLLERTDSGWTTVFDGGVSGNGNDLYGLTVTGDGQGLWMVGASGAIGEYDVQAGTLEDRSAPNDNTDNFSDVAATGDAGAADVYVVDGSGTVHYSFDNGEEGTWEEEVPGSGAALVATDFHGSKAGHVVDADGTVFATDDGTTWNAIGLEDADVSLYGLDSDAADDVTVSGGNASIFEYDGTEWTSESLGGADLFDVEIDGGEGVTVGGGAAIFEYDGAWSQVDTSVTGTLNGAALGDPEIAVGAGGLVLEAADEPSDPPEEDTLTVTSSPDGADVSLDGNSVGTTPYEDELPVSESYDITVDLDGYQPETRTDVSPPAEEHFDLEPEETENWWDPYTDDDDVASDAGDHVIPAIDDFEATGDPTASQVTTVIESFETGTPVPDLT